MIRYYELKSSSKQHYYIKLILHIDSPVGMHKRIEKYKENNALSSVIVAEKLISHEKQ